MLLEFAKLDSFDRNTMKAVSWYFKYFKLPLMVFKTEIVECFSNKIAVGAFHTSVRIIL